MTIITIPNNCKKCPYFSRNHYNQQVPSCQHGATVGEVRGLPHGPAEIDEYNRTIYYEATGVVPEWCPLHPVNEYG
jgi:hypothetical protein